jgi:hypothetical protein
MIPACHAWMDCSHSGSLLFTVSYFIMFETRCLMGKVKDYPFIISISYCLSPKFDCQQYPWIIPCIACRSSRSRSVVTTFVPRRYIYLLRLGRYVSALPLSKKPWNTFSLNSNINLIQHLSPIHLLPNYPRNNLGIHNSLQNA